MRRRIYAISAHSLLHIFDDGGKRAVVEDHLIHALASIDCSRMVVFIKQCADTLIRNTQHIVTKIHGHLPWQHDFAVSAFGEQTLDGIE